jgi:ribonuclease HII
LGFRQESLFEFDQQITAEQRRSGYFFLIGIDEAGRGPWAGPVVASAVHLPQGFFDPAVNDSKQCSPRQREKTFQTLTRTAAWGVGIVEAPAIDSINILQATHAAMRSALQDLVSKHPHVTPHLVLVDGNSAPRIPYPLRTVVQGDAKSAAIAAASIIAKVTRDRLMEDLDRQFPQYGFSKHKGYGTPLHLEMLQKHGPSPVHRKTFAPVRRCLI